MKRKPAPPARTPAQPDGAGQYRHAKERANNPSVEMTTSAPEARKKPKDHRKNVRTVPADEPQLAWNRAPERLTAEAPVLSRIEQIDPSAWLRSLRGRKPQQDLFAAFNAYDDDNAKLDWYRHAGNWSNRLIHADARRAMVSLLEHESMAGAVQMIYFDPPYGMDYDASYKDADDATMRRAFIDTYDRGIHSYLDGLRDTLRLARELLTETGSLFMQIGDVNVHRAALILDEVFGAENRAATIAYATTGGGSSTKRISKNNDFILWYAKNIEKHHFHALYEEQDIEAWCDGQTFAGGGGDFPDGTVRALKPAERRDPKNNLPEGTKLWRMMPTTSQGASQGEQGRPYTWNGIRFGPEGLENRHWSVEQQGLDALAEANRLFTNVDPKTTKVAGANQLHMKVYRAEMPGKRVNTIWTAPISPSKKRYRVKTGELAIRRCLLMTTKPGDLVLDPTSGDGTTSRVAEEWGRRWIAVDSSREAVACTREQMLLGRFTRHLLLGTPEGFGRENGKRAEIGREPLATPPPGAPDDPATGIVTDQMRYVSAASLAYRNRPDKPTRREWTVLVDRPLSARAEARVASPFTVETELTKTYLAPDELLSPREKDRQVDWAEKNLDELRMRGIGSPDVDQQFVVENLRPVDERGDAPKTTALGEITHRCNVVAPQSGKRSPAYVAVWPRDLRVGLPHVKRNVDAVFGMARKPDEKPPIVVVIGAEFDPGCPLGYSRDRWALPTVLTKPDVRLHQPGTRAPDDDKASGLLMIAEPALRIEDVEDGRVVAVLEGWHYYNPVTGEADWLTPDAGRDRTQRMSMWMIDTDYDGTEFFARRIHFAERHRGDLDRLVGRNADPERMRHVFGNRSETFERPATGQIGIRIILENGCVLSHAETIDPAPAA